MAVMDNGFIEVGNIMTQASSEVIRKLKSILDQHGIFHIFDGVLFYPPPNDGARRKAIPRGRVKQLDHRQDDFLRDKQILIDHEKYQELIVPDLYKLNFMSIVYFDAEEADFLAMLIYGEN